jgi:hypothetical protein
MAGKGGIIFLLNNILPDNSIKSQGEYAHLLKTTQRIACGRAGKRAGITQGK